MKKYIIGSMLLALIGCGGETVNTEIVDLNMITSKDNALVNGRAFAKSNYGSNVERVTFQSDSTISNSCRFGDGWASGKIFLDNQTYLEVKCQTTGSGKGDNGCLLKEDFFKKDYSDQEGKCDKNITKMSKLGE